ncbi:MAG TPA: TMEM175 family protein [Streptosporangiaceae bacterium]|nr:TMEM175 family protein [Streptosporangiaceae bacterium]
MPDGTQHTDTKPAAPSPRTRRPAGLLARSGHLEYDRILFFSDAVFAIAITLLIVELPTPIENALNRHLAIQSGSLLRDAAATSILGFGISFGVIGLFWVGHHGLFRYVKVIDRPLMLLNLLFIGTIAFLPYPTDLLSSVSNQAPAVVFYAACAGAAGLLETIMWLYATRARAGLVENVSPDTRRLILLRTGRTPVIFAISIVIAQFSPRAATYSWLAIVVVGVAASRRYGHHETAESADPA